MARREVATDELTNEFVTDKVKFRGVVYVLNELSAAKYNKTVKQATNKDEDTGAETFDNSAHTRILISQCVKVGGKSIDVEDFYSKGNRLVRAMERKVLDLHLSEEPEEEITDDDEGEVAAASTSA